MLAGIGVIIILKQIPHAFGYDANFEGASLLFKVMVAIPSPHYLRFLTIFGSVVITVVSLIILIAWDKVPFKRN
jgi:MFS superfamily sulfate permease-like transporter